MARLVNARTGSVVVVPDEKVENLTVSGFFTAEAGAKPAKKAAKPAAKKATAKKAAASKSEK